MYSAKHAQLIMGALPLADITIYTIDVRAFGKGYDEFYEQSKAMGVQYVRGKVARIEEQENGNLLVHFENLAGGGMQTMEHDLVVLTVGLVPNPEALRLFKGEALAVDDYSYPREPDPIVEPSHTSIPGSAGRRLGDRGPRHPRHRAARRGRRHPGRRLPGESEGLLMADEPRPDQARRSPRAAQAHRRLRLPLRRQHLRLRGCGQGGRARRPAKTGVVVSKNHMFTCSDAAQQEIIDDIRSQGLEALVIASCSPKLHQLTFRTMAERGGINPYEYVQVNLREQCSWAHTDDRDGATEKGTSLVKAGIAKASLGRPLEAAAGGDRAPGAGDRRRRRRPAGRAGPGRPGPGGARGRAGRGGGRRRAALGRPGPGGAGRGGHRGRDPRPGSRLTPASPCISAPSWPPRRGASGTST